MHKTLGPVIGFAVSFALIAAAGVFLASMHASPQTDGGQGENGQSPQTGDGQSENGQPQAGWRQFRSIATYQLDNTEDDQPIENAWLFGPFPNEFENLWLKEYYFTTSESVAPRGDLYVDDNGEVHENTLVGNAPIFMVANTSRGYRMQIRADNLYPGDMVGVNWVYWAPENTVLYDEPHENWMDGKVWTMFGYSPPTKNISTHPSFRLFYEDNYQSYQGADINLQDFGTTWWEWRASVWIENAGWYFASSTY